MENEEIRTQTDETTADAVTAEENGNGQEQTPSQETGESMTPPDIEALIAEAEQRGYDRGINEQMARSLNEPGLFEDLSRKPPVPAAAPSATDQSLTSRFLTEIRPSVWDNL